MTANQTKNTPTARAGRPLRPVAVMICGAMILLVILAIYSYGKIKAASYSRLAPMSVSVELAFLNQDNPQNVVILEYDYGYGFIPAHRQSRVIQSEQANQVIEFTVSSWKPTGALRLSVKDALGVNPRFVTLAKLDKTITVEVNELESSVILSLDDVTSMFSDIPASPSVAKVN